jgi:hypothetical protein
MGHGAKGMGYLKNWKWECGMRKIKKAKIKTASRITHKVKK